MYFVFIHENRRMKPVRVVLIMEGGWKRENGGDGKSNEDILQANM
jgi:hypothetical protein